MKEPGDPFKSKVFGLRTAGCPSLGPRGRGTGNIALCLPSSLAGGGTAESHLQLGMSWLIPGKNSSL